MEREMIDLIELEARRTADGANLLAKHLHHASVMGHTSPEGRMEMRALLALIRRFVDRAEIQLQEPM